VKRIILHIDMDAFFAAIEQRDRPELRGRPVIVGGQPGSRGVVSSASYEARTFGVRSAMPAGEAHRLCPDAVFVPVDMQRYALASRELMDILGRFTPLVEPLSIDEAFLDMTGTGRRWGTPREMGQAVKTAVREGLHVTASVGVAPSKFIAKLASDAEKPDGLVFVPKEDVRAFLAGLPIRALWGVGGATERQLRRLGITTVGRLAEYPREVLAAQLGQGGEHLHDLANGIDDRPVEVEREVKSVSSETTFERDIPDGEVLRAVLFDLAEEVAWRLRRGGLRGRTVTLKLRFEDFRTITRSRSRPMPVDHGPDLFRIGEELLDGCQIGRRHVRLIGIGVSQLCGEGEGEQLTMFEAPDDRARRVDAVMDHLAERFGRATIGRARKMKRGREG